MSATSLPSPLTALHRVVFGDRLDLHLRVRHVVAALGDDYRPEVSHIEQVRAAAPLLRRVIAALDAPSSGIAADVHLRGALCAWAAIAAPRLLPVLTGHLDLAIGLLRSFGDDSVYQRELLADLDTGAAIGVLALTELGGTNGANQQTSAVWDPDNDEFVLSTPDTAATKFMPNIADPEIAKVVVVTARLRVQGRDVGVVPFVFRPRTRDGHPVEGLRITALPEKGGTAMDHAAIEFDGLRLPRQALLASELIEIDDHGGLRTVVEDPRRRLQAILGVLDDGRVDLADAAAATARAAVAGLVRYSGDRRIGATSMREHDNVHADIDRSLAATYAITALARQVRDLHATRPVGDRERAVWAMLTKALLSATAIEVTTTCAERLGAQGTLRANLYPDWLSALRSLAVAEGETRVLLLAAATDPDIDPSTLSLPGTLNPRKPGAMLPWWLASLVERERRLRNLVRGAAATDARPDERTVLDYARSVAERAAVCALWADAAAATDPQATDLLEAMTFHYAAGLIQTHAAWYLAEGLLTRRWATALTTYRDNQHPLLCRHYDPLVEAFALPPLPSPVHIGYLDAWQRYLTPEPDGATG
ncbi:acyl-CoA dehydrogenase family protein [Nocardia takedensis]|uniref:acyl-CoA dehydrogenase family protein n=1 Tax=Nocardia takedensis TaxID=259390 RepID=UPI0003064117|nr:acyl-CoA dehydrogenase family protein [Nocardia takedensis]